MKFYGIDTTKTSFTAHFPLPPLRDSVAQVAPYNFNFNFSHLLCLKSGCTTFRYDGNTAIQPDRAAKEYLAMFENSGYEGYFNWRRTGVPAFLGGSGVGNNGVSP